MPDPTATAAVEYEIQGDYGQGWEMVTTEDTLAAARDQLRSYNENEPEFRHRVKIVRATHGY